MGARIIADSLVGIHLGFILFVTLGGLLVFKWRKLAFAHIPCALWGGLIEFTGWICPLTPLENHFRRLAGELGYAGGFVDHYITPLIYPEALGRGTQIVLGIFVIALNTAIYGTIVLRRQRARRQAGRGQTE